MKSKILAIAMAALCSTTMFGQAPQAAPLGPVEPAKAADFMVSNTEKDFIALIEAMPADKYSFAPSASLFKAPESVDFKGVRTFAQLVTHTIQANYFYWSPVLGEKLDQEKIAAIGKLTDKDAIVKAAKESMEYGHKAAASITAANAFEGAGRGAASTKLISLAGGVIHIRDEYGQMVVWGRMVGVAPPASSGRPPANPANK